MTVSNIAHAWRSLLYVPGNNERFLSKAQSRGADALILDLEDSVPDDRKSEARKMVSDAIEPLAKGPSALVVRINGGVRAAVADLEKVVRPGLSAVMISKCETPEKPAVIGEILSDLEAERGLPLGKIALIALVETPGGLADASRIAHSDSRLAAMLLGSEDFATACRMDPSQDTLKLAKQSIIYAARSAGLAPLGLLDTVANFSEADLVGLVERSKQFGFSGSTCVHPRVVNALNDGFQPSVEEIREAQRIVAAMAEANKKGRGAASLDGRMIDAPLLKRAQDTLAQVSNAS
ncbi:MAG: CoA ester lyase [Pseudomonadota bacterium]